MGGITSTFNLTVGAGLSGAGSVASPLTNTGVLSAGNGLNGTNPIALAAPPFNTVGSVVSGMIQINIGSSVSGGTDYSAGAGNLQVRSGSSQTAGGSNATNNLSGTWRYMGNSYSNAGCSVIFNTANFYRVA